ncbi:tolA domain protein [Acinetobacter baumannii 25681_6]|nr:tolA domain protein [Acinetobacter baumannii 25681_6]
MQDEKREALPLLSEHNNFVRVTCFKYFEACNYAKKPPVTKIPSMTLNL